MQVDWEFMEEWIAAGGQMQSYYSQIDFPAVGEVISWELACLVDKLRPGTVWEFRRCPAGPWLRASGLEGDPLGSPSSWRHTGKNHDWRVKSYPPQETDSRPQAAGTPPLVVDGRWNFKGNPGLTYKCSDDSFFRQDAALRPWSNLWEPFDNSWLYVGSEREATREEVAALPGLNLDQRKRYDVWPKEGEEFSGEVARAFKEAHPEVKLQYLCVSGEWRDSTACAMVNKNTYRIRPSEPSKPEPFPRVLSAEELEHCAEDYEHNGDAAMCLNLIHTARVRTVEAAMMRVQRDQELAALKANIRRLADE